MIVARCATWFVNPTWPPIPLPVGQTVLFLNKTKFKNRRDTHLLLVFNCICVQKVKHVEVEKRALFPTSTWINESEDGAPCHNRTPCDMTEKLLNATLNQNKQTNKNN